MHGAQADNIRRSILKHSYYLAKSGICMRTFHVAQIHIHRNVSRDSDIRPTLKHLVVPLDLHCPSTCRHICQSLTLWCFSLFKKHDQRIMANLCKGVSWTCYSWWNSQIPAANHANSRCAFFALCEAGDKPPTQTNDSQFKFSQFMKCNFFSQVATTHDAMVDYSLRSPIACHNAKATNS